MGPVANGTADRQRARGAFRPRPPAPGRRRRRHPRVVGLHGCATGSGHKDHHHQPLWCGGPRKRRERKARLELRAAMVDLVPPTDRAGDEAPLAMLAVSVLEPEPPKGKMPLHRVLLTTEGEAEIDNARPVVAWYEARWTIEEYFWILNVGTRVEDRKLDHADDLRKCLAFDAVTAWRVMDLERRARDTPDMPALKMFSEHEIKVLYV